MEYWEGVVAEEGGEDLFEIAAAGAVPGRSEEGGEEAVVEEGLGEDRPFGGEEGGQLPGPGGTATLARPLPFHQKTPRPLHQATLSLQPNVIHTLTLRPTLPSWALSSEGSAPPPFN